MNTTPVACPVCGNQPGMRRYRASFWQLFCQHMTPVVGHPMKTQQGAIEAWNAERIAEAVRHAVHAIRADPNTFPKTPTDWPDRATAALDSRSPSAILVAGVELRSAHSQYSADFDRLPHLWVLRAALPHPLRSYLDAGYPVGHLAQATSTSAESLGR
ncbi:hypothetical protein [Ottowia sp.]|uniref:hypothetical protein n=1 Tax=Ottowia sp. TaxID=1898956 RepID=UPI0025EBC4DD|nr:hypothetical protein [Ottowia sp.]MBK6616258.1 hypothetical protein [Ottowia sp.]